MRVRTWLSVVVLLSILLLVGSRFGVFDPVENTAQSIAEPVESALRDATAPVADFVNNLTDINRLSDENQVLTEENERLRDELARLREAETELQQLRQLLDLRGAREGDRLVDAAIIAHEPNNLQRLIAIDRGTDDGLAEGMIVLSPQGSLVGTITRALDDVSWVTLITDQTSAVSALIQSSRVDGVVAGSADGTLTMEFVEETADVSEGDIVLTSGVGGRYPQGELVGQVVEVSRAAQELFQEVQVRPLADFSALERVLVLSSFVPREAPPP